MPNLDINKASNDRRLRNLSPDKEAERQRRLKWAEEQAAKRKPLITRITSE